MSFYFLFKDKLNIFTSYLNWLEIKFCSLIDNLKDVNLTGIQISKLEVSCLVLNLQVWYIICIFVLIDTRTTEQYKWKLGNPKCFRNLKCWFE